MKNFQFIVPAGQFSFKTQTPSSLRRYPSTQMQPSMHVALQTCPRVGFLHVFWQPLAPHWLYSSLALQTGLTIEK